MGRSGDEALPLLLTLSSGVKGYTTIHAGLARQALTRLRFVCQLADTRSELPMAALHSLVSEAIDIVVHCARVRGVPRVTEIVAVENHFAGADSPTFTVTPLFSRARWDAPLAWSGQHGALCRPRHHCAGRAGGQVFYRSSTVRHGTEHRAATRSRKPDAQTRRSEAL